MSIFIFNKISRLEAKPQNRVESALYFLGFVVAGLVVLPLPLMLILNPRERASGFYEALFEGYSDAWLIVIAPYLVFQLVRSVLWALRASRE